MTPFGQEIRRLRDTKGVTLKAMAKAVGVSPAYLSALEHGKKGAPTWYLVQRMITYFNVIWDEAERLARLAQISHPKVTIDTAGLIPQSTEFAHLLSKSISSLSADQISEMTSIVVRSNSAKNINDI